MELFETLKEYLPLLGIVVWKLICGGIARTIVGNKRYPDSKNHGFAWGFLLEVIGILICLAKPMYKKPSKPVRRNSVPTGGSETPRTPAPPKPAAPNFGEKVRSLHDDNDVKTQASAEGQKRIRDAKAYRGTQSRSYPTVSGDTIRVDMSWSENLAELLEATEVVYTNAEMNCNKPLLSQKFEYYIRLHYRSFTAADLCHAKLNEIRPQEQHVRNVVRRLNDREDSLRVDKATYDELVSLRNALGDLCKYLANQRDAINHQTGLIRDKIRDECGTKGKDWYEKLKERSGK